MTQAKKIPFDAQTFLDSVGKGKRILEYSARDVIFAQGDPADCVMYVRSGGVQLSVISRSGKEAVVGTIGAGIFLGEGALTGHPIRLETATATVATSLLLVPKRQMLKLLSSE